MKNEENIFYVHCDVCSAISFGAIHLYVQDLKLTNLLPVQSSYWEADSHSAC
jgi:hypothetical protein